MSTLTFSAPINRVIEATRDHVPALTLPGQEEAKAVGRVAKRPLVKRVIWKLVKTGVKAGVGAGVGAYVGKRLLGNRAAKVGAISGAVEGIIFNDPRVLINVRAGLEYAAKYRTNTL